MTSAAFARRETSSRWQRFSAEIAKGSKHHGEETAHDVRVAIRRLTQALRVFAPLLADKQAKRLRKELRPLLDAAAVVRDCDIALQLLRGAGLPSHHAMWDELRAERSSAEARFRHRLADVTGEAHAAAWPRRLGIEGEAK